jgi:hypothetical protein
MNGRLLKKDLLNRLKEKDLDANLRAIREMPPRRVISPLISFLCATDETVKWRAILAIGETVSALQKTDMESARIIIRRLMWHLNDESGGIGWGVPEAMGEIMARNPKLAREYGSIIVSYIRPDAVYIEHPMLQRGVLWGIGRLAHAQPERVTDAACLLPPYLQSHDAAIRGLAVYAAGPLPKISTQSLLQKLTRDKATFEMFLNRKLVEYTVGRMAQDVLQTKRAFRDGPIGITP